MAKGTPLDTITAAFASATKLNANFASIISDLDNTISRDGSTPNQMEADLDMNNNDILNVNDIDVQDITVAGTSLAAQVAAAAASAAAALVSEIAAAASAALAATLTLFTTLTDTPSSYSGEGGKFVKVNAGETALEFVAGSGSEPSDGDKGDVTVTASGLTWSLDANVVDTAEIAANAVTPTELASNAVTTVKILDDNVTYGKIQNVVADNVLLGNNSGAGGIVDELTGTEATALLDVVTSGLKGLAPASGGGTTNFLRADGTFAAPAAGALVFVSEALPSAVSTVDFIGLGTYNQLVFIGTDITQSGAAQITIRTSTDNGSTWTSSAAAYDEALLSTGSDTSNTATEIAIANSNSNEKDFKLVITGSNDASVPTRVDSGVYEIGGNKMSIAMGKRNAEEDNDAIQFQISAGTFTGGQIRCYGVVG